tara:strand:+ start:736 stop:1596 length:861 start_codon:yes stop_codon:yes gene_type:complete
MPIFIKSIKLIFEKSFLIKPKILSTLFFIPLLYLLGWILTKPFLLIGVGKENLSLIGTFFTFIIFVASMPGWFKLRWNLQNTWILLGVNKIDNRQKMIFYFLKGFLYSIILLALILIPLIRYKWASWEGTISPEILLNAMLLVIVVGFAEELIFRGWLLEELKNQFGLKKAVISQAILFSFVHLGFNLPFLQMISILFGLFLLGILLSLIRLKDDNCLWGCIGLHGGLVGLWFVINNGLINIYNMAPIWLVGPGNVNTNPLGGLYGINLLFVLLIYIFINIRKRYF